MKREENERIAKSITQCEYHEFHEGIVEALDAKDEELAEAQKEVGRLETNLHNSKFYDKFNTIKHLQSLNDALSEKIKSICRENSDLTALLEASREREGVMRKALWSIKNCHCWDKCPCDENRRIAQEALSTDEGKEGKE